MELQKRIGIIMGRIHKAVNKQLLEGMLEQAYSKVFSAYVFTLSEEEHNPELIHGQKNLLTAIQFAQLDGIVFAPLLFCFGRLLHIHRTVFARELYCARYQNRY